MAKLDATHTLYTKEEAIEVAEYMNEQDDEWSYKPVHDPKKTGWSFIEVYDEDGEFVERM